MLATSIPEEKGSFRRFVETLSVAGLQRVASSGRTITEFKYRYNERTQVVFTNDFFLP